MLGGRGAKVGGVALVLLEPCELLDGVRER